MKKLILCTLFLIGSCYNLDGTYCSPPSEYDKNIAQSYYDSFGTTKENLSQQQAKKLFGCHYSKYSDSIYSYNTFWGKKYILVRAEKAVTYVEGK